MAKVELRNNADEYIGAMQSVRLAKSLAWWLIFLALAAQIGSFVVLQFTDLVDPLMAAQRPAPVVAATPPAAGTDTAASPAPAAASRPTSQPAGTSPLEQAHMLNDIMYWALPIAKTAGPLMAMLLSLALIMAVKIVLVGRLGGAKGLTSAMFWSFLLLALVTPWQQVFAGSMLPDTFTNLSQLQAEVARVKASWGGTAGAAWPYYARFLGLPGVTLLVWLAVGIKFARGYRRMNASTALPPANAPTADRNA